MEAQESSRLLITSLQNGRIKQTAKLQSRRARDAAQQTVVEGVAEIRLALQNQFFPSTLYISPSIADPIEIENVMRLLAAAPAQPEVVELSEAVFAKLAYRQKTGGMLMVLPYWAARLDGLFVGERPFFTIIENVEKPGNLGAILRTADAVGVDGVIVCKDDETSSVDIYNPNAIRASLGAIFTVPLAVDSTTAVLAWAKQHNIRLIAAMPEATQPHTSLDLTQPIGIVMGSEAHGVSEQMKHGVGETAVIPMHGQLDSLNLSVSTAIMLYEAHRQRTTRDAPS